MTNIRILNDMMGSGEAINLFAEDMYKDERNIDQSKVYLTENTSIAYKKIYSDGHTIRDFLNILYCNSKKMKKVDKTYNVLVYLAGHGNDSVFKFQDRDWLCCEDLMAGICFLSRICRKILLIVDTCQAETMICREDLPSNVFAVTTSIKDESSLSTIHSNYIGVSCIDNFIFYLSEAFKESNSRTKLFDFFSCINNKPVGSTISFSPYEDFYLCDFFGNKF
ncbi:putative GPI-anchor transamidase [Nosema granulosis]|uniref:GPI-anchor transamidase n=1 Tax=Nosema granulosis TaxID=83296 RepID=A0A9P6H0W2_9MICR|nr:putative GPI-anchor transamidase [Nosema granulosis]